jgi:methylmalonyl-CoA/ethylmalonyl-CoA epimerase
MNHTNLNFHHFGLAVRRPDEARKFVQSLGYQLGDYVFDPAQNVHLQMCHSSVQPAVEIIWPGDTRGPVDKFAQRNPAGIVYHICYETASLTEFLSGLESAGIQAVCISPPTPAPLFKNRKVSFYNILGMGLVEVLE